MAAFALWAAVSVVWAPPRALAKEKTAENDQRLKRGLKQFPEADANGPGADQAASATEVEEQGPGPKNPAGRKQAQSAGKALSLPNGAVHKTEMAPMRDGVHLATDYYLPAGRGPWPAVVVRTPYNRKTIKQAGVARGYMSHGYAFVIQDWRGLFDSEGKFGTDSAPRMIDDGYDTVEWVARQPWCNGKVGITGASGPGSAAKLAVLANPPHLLAAVTSVANCQSFLYSIYHGGVMRAAMHDGWLAGRGVDVKLWPKPRTEPFDDAQRALTLAAHAKGNSIAVLDAGGWYDIFSQAILDDFCALDNGRYRATVMGKGHGQSLDGDLKYPPQNPGDGVDGMAWFDHWLKGADNGIMKVPPMRYFLMGDTMNPKAPGNVWKQAERWPVPNTPTSFYFTSDGRLDTALPSAKDASVAYAYDPRNPVPTIGGANLGGKKGPMDQRPLKDRKDIVRFVTPPLTKPLEITGKVFVELNIATDVPDTEFTAKLIDVYPNGYEALVLDTAMMARYWQGWDKPAPVEKGKVFKLMVDLWSTALVFDKGHSIAVHISSSNSPRYEVHPNSYELVNSYDNAPIAHQTVYCDAKYPSQLILPVIAPGVSKDYKSKR